jgi:hypothetical protein
VEEDARYETASIAASVVSGGALMWTLLSDPNRSNYAPGIVTTFVGLGDLLLAASGSLGEELGGSLSESEEQLVTLNAIVGTVTTLAGITQIVRVMNARSNRDDGPAQSNRWQPILDRSPRGRTQFGVTMRF